PYEPSQEQTSDLNELVQTLDDQDRQEFESDSDNFDKIVKYAERLIFKNQLEKALFYYNKALLVDPDRKAEAYFGKADVFNVMKQYDTCFYYYDLAADIGNNAEYYAMRANLQNLLKRRSDLALKDIQKAIELAPENVEYRFIRGIYKSELKDFSGAIEDMRSIPDNHIN